MGQYILANVTRIETPSGQSYSIEPGMLTASTGDGFIGGKLHEPGHRSGVGTFISNLGRSALNIGVASIAPQGDEFSDRLTQNVIGSGLDSVNSAIDGNGNQRISRRSSIPSFYMVKPKTSVSLVANGDIQLEQVN
jgi:hypothetical protein